MITRSSPCGVVFTAERPRALERCLSHLLPQDGLGSITVYDDSRRAATVRQNRAVIDRLARRFRRPVNHIGRDARRDLARALAKETGVSEALVRFGLIGATGATTTIGASRNAMLLTVAGRCSDDDVVPRVAALPFSKRGPPWLGDAAPPPLTLVCSSHPAALDHVRWLDRPVAALHARLLGQPVEPGIHIIGRELDLSHWIR